MSRERFEDITGLRSGKLLVIEKTAEKRKGSFLWRCKCDCGNEILAEAYRLKRGLVNSCGCSRKDRATNDLSGRQFGKLTVLKKLEEGKGSSNHWLCQCECGKEVSVTYSNLLSGNTTSCGCNRREALKAKAIDITNEKFGMLTALKTVGVDKTGSKLWECECECGNHITLSYNNLVHGNYTSCGCKKKDMTPPEMHYVEGTCVEMLESKNLRKDNTSGYRGVVKTKRGYKAQIGFKGKNYYLGTYDKLSDAIDARRKAEDEMYEPFLENYYQKQIPLYPRSEISIRKYRDYEK